MGVSGGKVEHKENHSDAVKREVMEELGAEIEITGLQDPIKLSYNHVKIRLLPYECKLTNNSPEPKTKELDHSELAWVECWDMWYVDYCLLIHFTIIIPTDPLFSILSQEV